MENSPTSASTATLDQPASTSTATLDQPSLIPATLPKQPRFPKGRGHRHITANHSEDSDIAKIVRPGLILSAATIPEGVPDCKPSTGPNPTSAKADTAATTTAAAYVAAREQTRQIHGTPKSVTYDSARKSEEVSVVAALTPVEQARTDSASASRQTTLQSPFQSPSKMTRPENEKLKSCAVPVYDESESAESDSGSGNEAGASFSDGESGSRSGSDGSGTGHLLT